MAQATDGNFYGVANPNSGGGVTSIYKVTLKGVFSTLYLFDGTIGTHPAAPLVQHTDGLLYGDTTTGTGTGQSNGIFYSWSIGAAPFLRLALTSGKAGTLVGMFGQGFDTASVVKFGGVAATSITLTGSTYIVATVPAGAVDGYVTVTTGSTTLTSTKTFTVHNSWSSGAAIPTAVVDPAVGFVGTKIYAAGGANSSGVIGTNQVYTPATNKWSTAAAMPTPVYGAASAVVNNILYVIGGYTATSPQTDTNVVQAYTAKTNTWSSKSPMPTARGSIGAAVEGGMIYVIGGYDSGTGQRLNNVEKYNPSTDTWTEEAPLLNGKSEPSIGLIGTTIVAADGDTSSGDTGDNEGYSASTNSWKSLASDPTARNGACSGSVGSLLYVAGGINNNYPPLNLTESFNLTANKWTILAPMPQATTFPGSVVANGLLYCIGGNETNGGNGINNVQIYQP